VAGKEWNHGVYRFGVLSGDGFLGWRRCGVRNQDYVQSRRAAVSRTIQLEDKTAENNRQIHAWADRTQAGSIKRKAAADLASQNAQNAGKARRRCRSRLTRPCIARTRWIAW